MVYDLRVQFSDRIPYASVHRPPKKVLVAGFARYEFGSEEKIRSLQNRCWHSDPKFTERKYGMCWLRSSGRDGVVLTIERRRGIQSLPQHFSSPAGVPPTRTSISLTGNTQTPLPMRVGLL